MQPAPSQLSADLTSRGGADSARVVAAIRAVLPSPAILPLHEPIFVGREWDYIRECLDTGWVSSVGAFVDRFEAMLAERCAVQRAVVMVNGTAALQVALQLVGVEPDDEVLVPSLTFVATANAVSHCGAIPHFVDVEALTLGIDPAALRAYLAANTERKSGRFFNPRTGRRISAIVPVHVFGTSVDMEPLLEVAKEFELPVVEDATEALGSTYKGRPCGSLGSIGVLSFNGNKIITTGGGGALLTDDTAIADRAKHLTTTAKLPHQWAYRHDAVGYNYRLPNLNAALGCAQLERLDDFVAAKQKLAARYRTSFHDVAGCQIFQAPPFASSNYWLVALILDRPEPARRDEILQAAHAAGILARPAWEPLHRLQPYHDCPAMPLSVTENLVDRIISLPSGPALAGLR